MILEIRVVPATDYPHYRWLFSNNTITVVSSRNYETFQKAVISGRRYMKKLGYETHNVYLSPQPPTIVL